MIILSAFFFACMNVSVRLAGDLPSIQKSFFRNLVAAPYKAAYGSMPTHAASNQAIQQMYINGHFCYA